MTYLIFIWIIAIFLLVYGGFYYSIILKFPQLRFKTIFSSLKSKTTDGISTISALSMSLAARIGVGSLSGIALAIYYGGPGSIFWIWVIGIINSVNTFVECYLGLKYQHVEKNNIEGGPAFYILKGLKNKKLSKIYALVVIITYIVGFISIQSNTIVVSLSNYTNFSHVTIGLALVCVVGFSIEKGLKRISIITEKIVFFITIIYILVILFVVFKNLDIIFDILMLIIKNAFEVRSIGGGFLSTMLIGIQRGVFSTESGLGTSSIAASSTKTKNIFSICFSQVLGIYFTIFVISTSTAIMILTSDYTSQTFNKINGIELTQYSFLYHMGSFGIIILIISVILFAYSTIIAGYYYGESNMNFLLKRKKYSFLLKVFTLIVVFLGSVVSPKILWDIVDYFVAILAIINMYSILRLSKEVKHDYQKLRNLI